MPGQIPYGAWGGLEQAAHALKTMCKPGQIPHVAQTGLGWGRLGLSAQSSTGPTAGFDPACTRLRAGPIRGPYGIKAGLPLPGKAHYAHGAPYQSLTGLGQGSYLG